MIEIDYFKRKVTKLNPYTHVGFREFFVKVSGKGLAASVSDVDFPA